MRIAALTSLLLLVAPHVTAQAPTDTAAVSPAARRVFATAFAQTPRFRVTPDAVVCLELTDLEGRALTPSAALLREVAQGRAVVRPKNCPRTHADMGGYVGPGAIAVASPASYLDPFHVRIAVDLVTTDTMARYRLRVGQGPGGSGEDCTAAEPWGTRIYSCNRISWHH